jgi:hypothetical protein
LEDLVVHAVGESELENDPVPNELVNMTQQLNFTEVDAEDVQKLSDSYDDHLTNEQLQELTEQNLVQEDVDSDINE